MFNDYKILLGIPLNNYNLLDLAKFLFNDKFINSYNIPNTQLVKFEEVLLIHNTPMYNYFFKFNNACLKQKIINYYNNDSITGHKNVVLTRSINLLNDELRLQDELSILSNLKQINDFFTLHNFIIIDPQKINDKELYNRLKTSQNIIIGNGSSLCPLITLNNTNVKVFCLNSRRYLPDWRKNCKNENELKNILDDENIKKMTSKRVCGNK